eukprot:s3325_g2.t1
MPSTETAAEADEIPLAIFDDLLRPPMAAQAAPGPVSPTLPSNGSLGHPDLCRSACVFVVGGTCLNGQTCTYCHLPHDEKRAKLDKRQRGWLKELSEAQLLPILLDHMQARAEDKGFARQAMGLLQLLQRRLRVLPLAARPEKVLAPKKLRNLDLALSRMTFFQLLRLAPQDRVEGVLTTSRGMTSRRRFTSFGVLPSEVEVRLPVSQWRSQKPACLLAVFARFRGACGLRCKATLRVEASWRFSRPSGEV